MSICVVPLCIYNTMFLKKNDKIVEPLTEENDK